MALVDPAPQLVQWTFRRVMWATLVLVLVGLGFWLVFRFYQVVFLLFVAIILGTVIRPAVTWLQRKGLPRYVGGILFYSLVLILLVSFVLLLFPLIIEQSATIAAAVPSYYQNLRAWMSDFTNPLLLRLSEFLPVTLPAIDPLQQTGPQMLAFAGQALGYLTTLAGGLFMATAIFLLAFHWTMDGPRTIQAWLQLVPMDQREPIRELIAAMESKIGFYIAGQGVLCLVIAILALIAYLLIGLPNALVLALIAGVLEAVPTIGPLLGAVPAAVIALSIAPAKLVWVIVATVVIQQLENIVLVPRIMRQAVGVNPFVSLLSIFAFSSLFGIAGTLMAIPIAAMLQILLERFVFHPGTLDAEISTGRDYASRLRYEAQNLAQGLRKQARIQKEGSDQLVSQTDLVMDEIEAITTDLDSLLAQVNTPGAP